MFSLSVFLFPVIDNDSDIDLGRSGVAIIRTQRFHSVEHILIQLSFKAVLGQVLLQQSGKRQVCSVIISGVQKVIELSHHTVGSLTQRGGWSSSTIDRGSQ